VSKVKNISENLSFLMDKKRLSANKLALAVGIPASTIKKIKSKEQANPTIGTLIPLAEFFGLTLEQFISGNIQDVAGGMDEINNARPAYPIPIIKWQNVLHRELQPINSEYIYSEQKYTKNAFAVKIEHDDFKRIIKHTFLVVEPSISPINGDFVLIANDDEIQLKQYLTEDNHSYLKSLIISTHVIILESRNQLIGVVAELKKKFKTIDQESLLRNNKNDRVHQDVIKEI
jgi:transcriptional regulator with XRE-family HTH domain